MSVKKERNKTFVQNLSGLLNPGDFNARSISFEKWDEAKKNGGNEYKLSLLFIKQQFEQIQQQLFVGWNREMDNVCLDASPWIEAVGTIPRNIRVQ